MLKTKYCLRMEQSFRSVVILGIVVMLGACQRAEFENPTDSGKPGRSDVGNQEPPQRTLDNAISNERNSPQEALDWPNFRGPGFQSTTPSSLPTQWDIDQGILWKTGLPGRGASSPVVFGDRLYITAYSGFGLTVNDPGECGDLRHHLLCFECKTGNLIWQREMTGTRLLQKMNPELGRHGFASSTAVTDGENVYVYFGVTGVFAFDKDGTPLWQRNLGLETHYFGTSASPVLHEDLLIVNASIESKTVYALNRKTGAAVWKIPGIIECWSTPVIGKNADGESELIVSSKNTVAAFDPATGKQLWHCAGIQDYVVAVPLVVDGICYLTGGKEKQTMAIRMGGEGDVEQTHKLWERKKIGSNVSSPVYRDGRLYIVHDNGIMQVLNAVTGDLIKRQRTATRDRPFASPLLANEWLYMPFQDAGISIFKADEECQEVFVNPRQDDLPVMASIVPSGDRFYYRNDRYLYCVGPEEQKTRVIEWSESLNHQMVNTIESYNIDPERGWSRRYLGFLSPNDEDTILYLLMPYQSVITDEQSAASREIILGEQAKYHALRKRFETLQWEELTAAATQGEIFRTRWEALEADTKKLNSDTRILVKNLFSEEQLQQHHRDSQAGIAHIKPEK